MKSCQSLGLPHELQSVWIPLYWSVTNLQIALYWTSFVLANQLDSPMNAKEPLSVWVKGGKKENNNWREFRLYRSASELLPALLSTLKTCIIITSRGRSYKRKKQTHQKQLLGLPWPAGVLLFSQLRGKDHTRFLLFNRLVFFALLGPC